MLIYTGEISKLDCITGFAKHNLRQLLQLLLVFSTCRILASFNLISQPSPHWTSSDIDE